ncbi:rod shape-determining protein MreC [Vibrio sp.]|nr:rod shape-determining protein MreC [Vibrio sp.]
MKPIFGQGTSLQFRLFLTVILSASLMLADSRLGAFAPVRYLLNSFVAPIQYVADLPRELLESAYSSVSSRSELLSQNNTLRKELLKLQSELILLEQYREENQRFRKLLESSFLRDEKKVVTEVMAVDTSPYRHHVVINKGKVDGVYLGQPVINEKGIVGQVTLVSAHNSRVLLLVDSLSAIPVQVIRNDIRVIASGQGSLDSITLDHIPTSTDIIEGDLLVSSGLGGVYPEGYPVALISAVTKDAQREFAIIEATPVVDYNRLRYLLLVWPSTDKSEDLLESPSEQPSNTIEAADQDNHDVVQGKVDE